MKTYYTLAVHEDGRWCPEFGDYSRAVVRQEMADEYEGQKTKIIRTSDLQSDIDAAIKGMNS